MDRLFSFAGPSKGLIATKWLKTVQIHDHIHVDDHVRDWQGLVVLDVDLVVDADGFSNQREWK